MLSIAVAAVLALTACSSDSETDVGGGVGEQRRVAVQADVDALVAAGAIGVVAAVTEDGETVTIAGGVADRTTGTPIPAEPAQHVRVGSITKTFASAVLLQLAAEGKVDLDAPVSSYLPDLLRGNGIDGSVITVRQLLRHQSGLPNFTGADDYTEFKHASMERSVAPREVVEFALREPAEFAPGAEFRYSNTNYIVIGMLVEQITGARFADELDRRVLAPLNLTGTYLPGAGDREIRDPHPAGYEVVDGVAIDVTRLDPSVPWTAGALVSTGPDLNRFYLALLDGEVVAPAELQQMREDLPGVTKGYGLGLIRTELPCGIDYFGHGGSIDGFQTISGATEDGRAVTITLTKVPDTRPDVPAILGHALCP